VGRRRRADIPARELSQRGPLEKNRGGERTPGRDRTIIRERSLLGTSAYGCWAAGWLGSRRRDPGASTHADRSRDSNRRGLPRFRWASRLDRSLDPPYPTPAPASGGSSRDSSRRGPPQFSLLASRTPNRGHFQEFLKFCEKMAGFPR
jgi:hypothetical protein